MCKVLEVNINEMEYSRNNKLKKKVSKYKDKNGNIKSEFEACIKWANDIYNESWVLNVCYSELRDMFYKNNKRKYGKLKNNMYIINKLSLILNKNQYTIEKLGKEKGFSVYSKEDVAEYILVLLEAVKRRKIREFLDVPDAFYIAKQIMNLGTEYYFAI